MPLPESPDELTEGKARDSFPPWSCKGPERQRAWPTASSIRGEAYSWPLRPLPPRGSTARSWASRGAGPTCS